MKTVFVFNAGSLFFQKQVNELNDFHQKFFLKKDVQAWIICEKTQNLPQAFDQIVMENSKVLRMKGTVQEEEILSSLLWLYQREKPDFVIFPSDYFGTGIAVRFAVRAGGSSSLGVVSSKETDDGFFIWKPVYANNLTAHFRMKRKPYCISIAKIANNQVWQPRNHQIEVISFPEWQGERYVLDSVFCPIMTDLNLDSAERVLALGRGVKTRGNLEKLEEMAHQLGFEIGVSKPLAMNGWTELGRLIGASGKLLSPRVCIAAGVSGAQAFMAGIQKSELIIAINLDEHAPIIKAADVVIIDDYHEVLEALLQHMRQNTVEGENEDEATHLSNE
jgi:electron transfer flavoprotein alpha subunit